MRFLFALACAAALAGPTLGQTIKLADTPAIQVKANRPIFINPVIDGDDVRWDIDSRLDDWIKLLPPDVSKNFGTTKIFYADTAGTYTVRAWTAKVVNVETDAKKPPILKAKLSDVATLVIVVDGGKPIPPPDPKPDPGPGPKPDPGPPPSPAPIPVEGFRVMIFWDQANESKLTAGQNAIVYGKAVRDYLTAKCPKGSDGKSPEFRIWPDGTDGSKDSPIWDAVSRRPRAAKNWVIISNGKTGFEGPMPTTEAEFMNLIKKFDGSMPAPSPSPISEPAAFRSIADRADFWTPARIQAARDAIHGNSKP